MKDSNVDIAVIGGGPAGLAASISAKENGANKVILFDRNNWVGGILPQCIHDGFGVEETGKSMTGPEYAEKYIKQAEKKGVKILKETMILQFDRNRNIIAVNREKINRIKTKSIILAMGCREKTRWNAKIPGDRPSGIYTAGVAQSFINLYNIMPGKRVVILGSGDVGLIMARRLKFEGANVLGVIEFLPYPSGLPRNIKQCLDDYDIPLYLNHTITNIEGKDRLEGVTITQVDEKKQPIVGTEYKIKCDTLLLSLGLIPENELSLKAGIKIDKKTGGPIVNQYYETSISRIFACGNCLQVYDTVDDLAIDAKKAGKNAAKNNINKRENKTSTNVIAGKGVQYIIPQIISDNGRVHFTLRAEKPMKKSELCILSGSKKVIRKRLRWINLANLIKIDVNIPSEVISYKKDLIANLYDR